MTTSITPPPSFRNIEDQHREAKERAAMLVEYFYALADRAGNEKNDLRMFAAFGFEHMAREIVAALDSMMQDTRALLRDVKTGGQQ